MVGIKVASKQQSQKDFILNVNLPNTVDYWEERNAHESRCAQFSLTEKMH